MKAAIWGPAEDEKELSLLLRPYLSRVSVFACQQGLAEVYAVAEFRSPGLNLRADPLVVLLQELHGWDIPDVEEGKMSGDNNVMQEVYLPLLARTGTAWLLL